LTTLPEEISQISKLQIELEGNRLSGVPGSIAHLIS
jgi:hypothetical protein